MNITNELDKLAEEIQSQDPFLALAIDKISDNLEERARVMERTWKGKCPHNDTDMRSQQKNWKFCPLDGSPLSTTKKAKEETTLVPIKTVELSLRRIDAELNKVYDVVEDVMDQALKEKLRASFSTISKEAKAIKNSCKI